LPGDVTAAFVGVIAAAVAVGIAVPAVIAVGTIEPVAEPDAQSNGPETVAEATSAPAAVESATVESADGASRPIEAIAARARSVLRNIIVSP
jgi:hypothetical protein